jgi:hypothetical protein
MNRLEKIDRHFKLRSSVLRLTLLIAALGFSFGSVNSAPPPTPTRTELHEEIPLRVSGRTVNYFFSTPTILFSGYLRFSDQLRIIETIVKQRLKLHHQDYSHPYSKERFHAVVHNASLSDDDFLTSVMRKRASSHKLQVASQSCHN